MKFILTFLVIAIIPSALLREIQTNLKEMFTEFGGVHMAIAL
jgi:hypothetical protein